MVGAPGVAGVAAGGPDGAGEPAGVPDGAGVAAAAAVALAGEDSVGPDPEQAASSTATVVVATAARRTVACCRWSHDPMVCRTIARAVAERTGGFLLVGLWFATDSMCIHEPVDTAGVGNHGIVTECLGLV
jgi:hypothetical protein